MYGARAPCPQHTVTELPAMVRVKSSMMFSELDVPSYLRLQLCHLTIYADALLSINGVVMNSKWCSGELQRCPIPDAKADDHTAPYDNHGLSGANGQACYWFSNGKCRFTRVAPRGVAPRGPLHGGFANSTRAAPRVGSQIFFYTDVFANSTLILVL